MLNFKFYKILLNIYSDSTIVAISNTHWIVSIAFVNFQKNFPNGLTDPQKVT